MAFDIYLGRQHMTRKLTFDELVLASLLELVHTV